jgi:16S rRNA (uracil1498-N3)-methyltransferase
MVQKAVEMGVSRLQPVLTRHTQVQRVNLDRMRANAVEAAEQCGALSIPDIAEAVALNRAIAARAPDRLLVFCDEDAEVKNPMDALTAARRVLESDLAIWNRDGAANSASPLPLGEVGVRSTPGEGLRSIESLSPPHPNPLPNGEREHTAVAAAASNQMNQTLGARLPPAMSNAPRPLALLIGPEGGFADDERAVLVQQPNIVRLSLGPRILRADTAAVAALALVQAVLGDWR